MNILFLMLDNAFGPWKKYYSQGVEITWKRELRPQSELFYRYSAKTYGISPVLRLVNRALNSRFQKKIWNSLPKKKRNAKVSLSQRDDTITANMLEIWSNISLKTQVAIDLTLINQNYQYLIRGNSTLYIDTNQFRSYLESLPRQRLYAGPIDAGKKFVSGWCIIMSRDVADLISRAELEREYFDDEAIGLYLSTLGIQPLSLEFRNVSDFSQEGIAKLVNDSSIIYRFKGGNGQRDRALLAMVEFHKLRKKL